MKKLALLLLLLAFGSGCAPKSKPLNLGLPYDNPVPVVYVAVVNEELDADVKSSYVAAATGGGLLPMLIDAGIESARSKKAASLLEPIRNALATYDFAQDIVSQLAARDIPGIARNAKTMVISQSKLKEMKDAVISEPLLSIVARQVFAYDFKSVRVEANVSYLKPTQDPDGWPDDYTKIYVSEHLAPVPEDVNDKEELGRAWAASPDDLQQVLHRGIAEILDLMQRDLDPSRGLVAKEKVRFRSESTRLRGPLYDRDADRAIVGFKDRVIVISQSQLLE